MSHRFEHPLARHAKLWATAGLGGQGTTVLVVITTLELDPSHKRYKAEMVTQLTDAARDWAKAQGDSVGDVVLMTRPKDWGQGR